MRRSTVVLLARVLPRPGAGADCGELAMLNLRAETGRKASKHIEEEETLQPATLATLERLKGSEWFSAVGEPMETNDPDNPDVLRSWAEAMGHCASAQWQELLLEAANRFTEQLFRRAPRRYEKWNQIVKDVKKVTLPLVKDKTRDVIKQEKLPRVFLDTVNWDILHVCMEAEYADVFPPGFFASQAFWYVTGRFPCGWKGGVFPKGKLLVY